MSVKETILDNLQTALEEITEDNGYSRTVKMVTREAIGFADFREDQLPLLKISSDTDATYKKPVGTDQRVILPVIVLGAIKEENVPTAAAEFEADVLKCLHAADLGSNVIYLQPKGGPTTEGEDIITFAAVIEIAYYYPEASP